MKKDLKSIPLFELNKLLEEMGEKPYHARQLALWIYQRGAGDFDQMSDISKSCRQKLRENYYISALSLFKAEKAQDSCTKYIFSLSDGLYIESVLIPEADRLTLCISTQVGCRQGCRFCLTAKMGFMRNLCPHEIIDQIIQVKKQLPSASQTFNIVLMGMGEPLDNYENTIAAIRLMTNPLGLNISPRRITLSTAGLIPQLHQLAKENLGINLAVSMNAPSDRIRNLLMPVNTRYKLGDLLKFLGEFPLPPRRRITIEYILIDGINDSPKEAGELCRKLQKIPCKVNLIPYNAHPLLPFKECSEKRLEEFEEILCRQHLTVTMRRSKGRDISAACGQLGFQHYQEHLMRIKSEE